MQAIAMALVTYLAIQTFREVETKLAGAPLWIHLRFHGTALLSGPLFWFPAMMLVLNILPNEVPFTKKEQTVLCVWLVLGSLAFLGLVVM